MTESQPNYPKPPMEGGINWDAFPEELFHQANELGRLIGNDIRYFIPYTIYKETRIEELLTLTNTQTSMYFADDEEETGFIYRDGERISLQEHFQQEANQARTRATNFQYRLKSFNENEDVREKYLEVETGYSALCIAAFEGQDMDSYDKNSMQILFFDLVEFYIKTHAQSLR